MRLFFALQPDSDAARQLAAWTTTLHIQDPARPVALENLHMTLAFIGSIEPQALEGVRRVAAQVATGSSLLCLDGVEWWQEAAALVATAAAAPALSELAARLRQALAQIGHGDPKPWRAHVTLARKVLQPPVLQAMSPICWRPKEFVLMQSARDDRGSVYTVVDTWPLLDESNTRTKSR